MNHPDFEWMGYEFVYEPEWQHPHNGSEHEAGYVVYRRDWMNRRERVLSPSAQDPEAAKLALLWFKRNESLRLSKQAKRIAEDWGLRTSV
jgi:hypothetical protein